MTECEYIIQTFKENFGKMEHKKIILYGIGVNTKTILEIFPQYNFLGLLDGFKDSGELYGKPIFPIDQVQFLRPDCIIIVARANSSKIICTRIGDFCKKNAIELYDIHGVKLLQEAKQTLVDHPYFAINEEQLKTEILQHDIISFDIFDTLLIRRVMYPEDVFALVEKTTEIKGFCNIRIESEKELYRQGRNPTHEEIYRVLAEKLTITWEQAESLMEREIQTERALLFSREDMLRMLQFAVAQGKRVFLISDMYLSRKLIESILIDCGFSGYEDIFVSVEYQTLKTQNLYEVFKKRVQGKSYLHIGDNADADIVYAQMHGLDSFRIYNAIDMAEISSYAFILEKAESLSERILVGFFLSKVFNSPFALEKSGGKAKIGDGYTMGYLFIGPLLTAFMAWLLYETAKDYSRILFSARDGYIFSEMYQLLRKKYPKRKIPKADYFYTSRMAAISATLFTEEDICYALRIAFDGTPADMLRQRFFLLDEEILPIRRHETLNEYVMRHKNKIFQRSSVLRGRYWQYIDSLKLEPDERLAFFDFVSSGTCQMCLLDLLDYPMNGFYFIQFAEDYGKKQALNMKAFVEDGFLYDLQSYLSHNYLLIESIIVSLMPTLKSFTEDGRPIYINEKRSHGELLYVKDVQAGILSYFKEYLTIGDIFSFDIRPQFVDVIYSLIQKKYSRVDNCVFENSLSRDEFCNREYVMDNRI
ncbi:Predicted hydrolase, HAD superfamily [Propionispira arboris]|uniref:Predicted hydrolase, HAD superfamily n=1 Tax=Propionispira arboris TaxID=84035 RepID=A0A1H7CLW5_9FIRM|nr:hypothetical protein [Propionispira arboris]SEJ87690.1 Predicted hydrolase, HAD superfamily [Propionispira arboris]